MGKSNYPNKLDTSIEIPAVRDNIVEVGSDVLNSLRSAIFNIERTLGINPQGAAGNTVSSRINRSLDGNGNILKEALDKAGLLSGPITNADVSKSAGIDEAKLNLKYPTTLLQDEISQIIKQIELISTTLEELAFLYAAHTHPEAKNRHKGHAITIEPIETVESDIGMISSERQTAQELFEGVFSSHINYSGSNISENNRSHEAKQLFFDKEEVSAYVYSDDVQGAIVDVLNATRGQVEGHQNLHHSNGVLRTSVIAGTGDRTAGRLLIDEQEISFSRYSPSQSDKLSSITFSDPPPIPEEPIGRSDILRLYSGIDESIVDYQIHSVKYVGTTVAAIEVFGTMTRNSDPLDRAKIFKNINTEANPAGLLVSARPFPDATNVNLLQVANPNSSTIVSNGIRPSEISVSNRYMNVVIDGETEVTVDVWDGAAAAGQTIDSIIKAMNIEFAEKAASVLAYRVDYDDLRSPEIALVHSLPSTTSQAFTLSVSKYQTDDGIYSLGFGHAEDEVIDQGSGSDFYIQGEAYSGLTIKLEQAGLTLQQGNAALTSLAVGVNFKDYGVTVGDLLVVTNTASDNGTYVIEDVSETSITVDEDQLSGSVWNGESTASSIFYILKSTVSLKEFEFNSPGCAPGSAATIVDIFIDKNRDIFRNVRLEYAIATHAGGESLIAPCDFEGDVSVYSEASPGIIEASLTGGGIPQLSLDGGPTVEMLELKSGYIRLKSGEHNISLLVFIEDSGLIEGKILADGIPFSINLFGKEDINLEENLLLARAHYDSQFSRITGAGPYLSRVFKKLEEGITSDKDLSSKALKRVYQGPLAETRSNGVVDGLKLTPAATPRLADSPHEYVVDIAGGACYVKGKKFVFEGYTDLISDVPSSPGYDKVFVAINEWGEIVFSGASGGGGGAGCICPFSADSHCILAVIEWDGLNPPVAIDLRLFLNDLDLTVLNSVTVSPQEGMGHFTEFGEALKYAKRFADMFPKAGTPTVHLKSGTHKVVVDIGVDKMNHDWEIERQAASYHGSWVNFPVNITGEGDSTILDMMKIFTDAGEESDDRTDAGQPLPGHNGFLFIAGPGLQTVPNGNADTIKSGFVTLSNFKMKNCSIAILDPWVRDYQHVDEHKLNWGVRIDGLIFDRSEKADFGLHNYSVMFAEIDSNPAVPPAGGGQYVGNLSISNCQFLNSYALFSGSYFHPSDHRNISFLNNVFRGTGDGEIDGRLNWIVWNGHEGGIRNIFDLDNAPWENNIEFRGNILADAEDGMNAYIDPPTMGLRHRWGDRVSRDLSVGGKTGFGATASTFSDSRVNIESGSYTDGLQVTGGVGIQSGKLHISNGNIEQQQGHIYTDGNINMSSGNINISQGNIYLQDGDISVTDDVARLRLSSRSTSYQNASELIFSRWEPEATIADGHYLGEIWFGGKQSSSSPNNIERFGALITAQAAGDWSTNLSNENHPTKITTWVSDTSGGRRAATEVYKDGTFRVFGGGDVTLDSEPTGVLLIGENRSFDSGLHLALDRNEIQAKNGPSAASTLHLNDLGGAVEFGPSANRLSILGSEISSPSGPVQIPGQLRADYSYGINDPAIRVSGGRLIVGSLSNSAYMPLVVQSSPAHMGAVLFEHGNGTSGQDTRILTLKFPYLAGPAMSSAQWFIMCESMAAVHGGIQATSGGISFVPFTGAHIAPIDDSEVKAMGITGLLVSADGTCLEGTENSVSEAFSGVTLSSSEKDKTVYGAIATEVWKPGAGESPMAYWNKKTNGVTVNSVGNGRVWVTNIAGEVQNGDYICSSNIPGYGQLQDDDLMHNYTAAKSTETIDWDSVTDTVTHNGIKYKKYLVACTYHCG